MLTADLMNKQLRDNMLYLQNRSAVVTYDGTYTTTSTSFVDVDATNLSIAFTSNGAVIRVYAGTASAVTIFGVVHRYEPEGM